MPTVQIVLVFGCMIGGSKTSLAARSTVGEAAHRVDAETKRRETMFIIFVSFMLRGLQEKRGVALMSLQNSVE